MDAQSLVAYLHRQRRVCKNLSVKPSEKTLLDLRDDYHRAKAGEAADVEVLNRKYFEALPRIAELKRMLGDCLLKLLCYFKHGNEGLWYEVETGALLLERMWQDFGCERSRPTRSQLVSYLEEHKALRPAPVNATHTSAPVPKLVDDVAVVATYLLRIFECTDTVGDRTSKAEDEAMNATVDQVWSAWHRNRRELALPHIESFDHFVRHSLKAIIRDMNRHGEILIRNVGGATVRAYIVEDSIRVMPPEMTPQHARTTGTSYVARVLCTMCVTLIPEGGSEDLLVDFAHYLSQQDAETVAEVNAWLDRYGFVPKGSADTAKGPLWTEAHFPMYLGNLPVMVGSSICHLHEKTPPQKVALGEEETEIGGYFVHNGNERIIRLMVHSRANYPLALTRPSFAKYGELNVNQGVMLRSVTPSGLFYPNSVLYQKTGVAVFSFLRRGRWLIPAAHLLLALKPTSLQNLYQCFLPPSWRRADSLGAQSSDERAANNLQMADQVLRQQGVAAGVEFDWTEFLGRYFQQQDNCQRWVPDATTVSPAYFGEYVLRRQVLPHLNSDAPLAVGTHKEEKERKFNFLVLMIRKLFDFVDGHAGEDNADRTANQQLLTPGDTLAALLAQGVSALFLLVSKRVERAWDEPEPSSGSANTADIGTMVAGKLWKALTLRGFDALWQISNLIATGNVAPTVQKSFGIFQNSGLSIAAERINFYRLLSQLRSTHRGSVIEKMRSSAARKLPLEAWGFLCPVETPDGQPCGVLNHLTAPCRVTPARDDKAQLRDALVLALSRRGLRPVAVCSPNEARALIPVTLDGEVLGYLEGAEVDNDSEANVGTWLRSLKCPANAAALGLAPLPQDVEVCCLPVPPPDAEAPALEKKGLLPLFPGLVLFASAGRFMRPVRSLVTGAVEYVGALEQVYLHIGCTAMDLQTVTRPQDRHLYRHMETNPGAILSVVSSFIAFFAHNPSPRNLFQCQMAKQTMGMFSLATRHRFDTKAYELRTPQVPIVRTEQYSGWGMESHPITTNAIVAITSYAEYDMEDAVVINKASLERGMFAGDVMKSFCLDLNMATKAHSKGWSHRTAKLYSCFRRNPKPDRSQVDAGGVIGADGLPRVGAELRHGTPYFECADVQQIAESVAKTSKQPKKFTKNFSNYRVARYKKTERCFVDAVEPCEVTPDGDVLAAMVRVRIIRNPVLGDKFSSQHGQKGTMSLMMPAADMPFSDSGMSPDVLINPHAFPSRMTVGMMLEMLAGKLGAVAGRFITHEASAWSAEFSAKAPHDLLGEQLVRLGFDYQGDETLYSGVTGQALTARIFMGCCAYQRLRHMVMDKWQCREKVGPVDITTLQPVKGRKIGGGIKVGEMERDALLSHGCVNLVTDRLYSHGLTNVPVCVGCGSFLTLQRKSVAVGSGWYEPSEAADDATREEIQCSQCPCKEYRLVGLPFAFIYLCVELLALNMELCLDLKGGAGVAKG